MSSSSILKSCSRYNGSCTLVLVDIGTIFTCKLKTSGHFCKEMLRYSFWGDRKAHEISDSNAHVQKSPLNCPYIPARPGGYKTISMVNSTEHEISTAHKSLKTKVFFLAFKLSDNF